MLLLELNEFNPGLLDECSNRLGLKNVRKLLSMQSSVTFTEDKLERFGLDPWVQWPSIHTGLNSKVHALKHLGDIPKLDKDTLQIWELLFQKYGVEFSVWGAMNASLRNEDGCNYFFPDPWTFTERAYPQELNNLLDFPRYYVKNYLKLFKNELFTSILNMIIFIFKIKTLGAL